MKFLPLSVTVVAVAALMPSRLSANALMNEAPKVPEMLPAGAQVAGLEVQPAKVSLSGRYEAVQLVVTAKLASGDVVDVTRIAKLVTEGDVAEVSPLGKVLPLRNGAGNLRVEIAGKTAAVPVEVA